MAADGHLAILSEGVDAWNRWRDSDKGLTPDLSGANLSGLDFGRGLYSRSEAERSEAEMYLEIGNLSRASPPGIDLSNAKLSHTKLVATNLARANLSGADLSNAIMPQANLSAADLTGANLLGANLVAAHMGAAKLSGADLSRAYLHEGDLRGANLSGAKLVFSHLSGANLSRANLTAANLSSAQLDAANLSDSDLSGAKLTKASLRRALLVNANLTDADLTGCKVFGVSAWNIKLSGAKQQALLITDYDEPEITVDNLKVAQFIYLLLNNEEIRDAIDTITSKVVLIVGRFTPERKPVLDRLRDELRVRNYLPIVFDFAKPASRNFTETVSALAHLARFIIADITEPRSIPQELQRVVPDLPSVPVQSLIHSDFNEWGMFRDFFDYSTVLAPYRYDNVEELCGALSDHVIAPVERKAGEIARRRAAWNSK